MSFFQRKVSLSARWLRVRFLFPPLPVQTRAALPGALSAVALAFPVAAQNPLSVTFARDIAPVVYQNCTPCHRPGEAAPFTLLTYEDVKKHARQIVTVTRSRYMPPWLPQPGYGDFEDERRLNDAQIKLIADWANAGAPEGNPSETPAPP